MELQVGDRVIFSKYAGTDVKYNGEAGAREHGVLRPEGKEYEMKDGDVVEFMFSK